MSGARAQVAGAWLAVLAACSPGTPGAPGGQESGSSAVESARAVPTGTVLTVGDVPILAAEVAEAADAMGECNPAFTRRAAVRQALMAQLIPTAAVRAHHAAEANDARALALSDRVKLRAGAPDAPQPERVSGTATTLAFDLWRRTRNLAPGEWQGPFAAPGAFFCARLVERTGEGGNRDRLEIDAVFRSFMPPGWSTGGAADCMGELPLTIVDPDFREAIPLAQRAVMAEVIELDGTPRRDASPR